MSRRSRSSAWTSAFNKGLAAFTRSAAQAARQVMAASLPRAARPAKVRPRRLGAPPRTPAAAPRSSPARLKPVRQPVGLAGDWLAGTASGPTGARRFRLYRPPGVHRGERLPVLVMLHGCGQDAQAFADSTRMNAVARCERFLVLYPEQDRFSNAHGCWNWFDTRNGRAQAELAILLLAIDQVCLLHRGDPMRVAVAGLSAGASMAALLASQYPARVAAVVMHSGVGPGAAHSSATALAAMRGLRLPLKSGVLSPC